jgi:hypothetical protein
MRGAGFALVVCLTAPSLRAQTTEDQARVEWSHASVEYSLGHFAAAARLYEDAYRLVQDPALLFNLGQAQRKAGAIGPALEAYRSYLRRSPPGAPDRELAQKRIEDLEGLGATSSGSTQPMPGHPAVDSHVPDLLTLQPAPERSSSRESRRWWWWGIGGAVLAAAAASLVLVLGNRPQDPVPGHEGTVTIK